MTAMIQTWRISDHSSIASQRSHWSTLETHEKVGSGKALSFAQ